MSSNPPGRGLGRGRGRGRGRNISNVDSWHNYKENSTVDQREFVDNEMKITDFNYVRHPNPTVPLLSVTQGPIDMGPRDGLSGIVCPSMDVANRYFTNFDEHGCSVYDPIFLSQHGSEVFLIGGYIGNDIEEWKITVNTEEQFWIKSGNKYIGLSERVKKVGMQILKFLNELHQNDKFVGNFTESLRIHPRTSEVKFTIIGGQEKCVVDGIKDDLNDFRSFLANINPLSKEGPEEFLLFDALYRRIHTCGQLDAIKDFSYLICHAPLFWEYEQRYNLAHKLYKMAKLDKEHFRRMLKLNSGMTDMTSWQYMIQHGPFLKIYSNMKSMQNREQFEDNPNEIVLFIRNTFNHPGDTDSLRQLDEQLLEIFPGLFSKVYLDLISHMPYRDLKDILTSDPSIN